MATTTQYAQNFKKLKLDMNKMIPGSVKFMRTSIMQYFFPKTEDLFYIQLQFKL